MAESREDKGAVVSRFTAEAEAVWVAIPAWAKEKLLSTVWCPHCRTGTSMVDFGGKVEKKDLVLHGRCASCGGEIARVVESE